MRIYFSKAGKGRTTEMIKDFVKQTNAVFISDELTRNGFIRKCNELGFDIESINSNIFINRNICSINELEDILYEYQKYNIVFIDSISIASNNPLNHLKKIEYDYRIQLNVSYQKGCNSLDNGIEIVEI